MTPPTPRGARAPAALAACLAALCAALVAFPVSAADEPARTERLQVTDPYLEMRTGPGRGYPIHHVAARAEWVDIELRYTDWYKVRTESGKEGWVHRRQLVTTLTDAGVARTFRDLEFDDYRQRRVELGAGWGHFKQEPMLKFWAGYKLSESINVELTAGQVQGVFSGTSFWHANLQLEPFSDQRISPFFAAGMGNFKNIPNSSLVSAIPTDAKLANASIGLRYYLAQRFVLRADYSIYTAFLNDTRSTEYRALTAGLSFFF